MVNALFGKKMQNKRKHRDFKLVTSDKRRSILASEPNYYTSKHFRRLNDNRNEKGRGKNE